MALECLPIGLTPVFLDTFLLLQLSSLFVQWQKRYRESWQAGWFYHCNYGTVHNISDKIYSTLVIPLGKQNSLSGVEPRRYQERKFIVISPKPLRLSKELSQFALSSTCTGSTGIWADKQMLCRTWITHPSVCTCKSSNELPGLLQHWEKV